MKEYNILLLGAVGVGKSALTVKYITHRFIVEYDPGIEDTYTKRDCIDGQECSVKIMDTFDPSGSCPDSYLKWCQAIMVVYSIVDRASFTAAKKYLDNIMQYQQHSGRMKSISLIGNQADLERYRVVSRTSGQELASSYDCMFNETSAAEDMEAVEAIFHDQIRDLTRLQEQVTLPTLYIAEDKLSVPQTSSTNSTNRTARLSKTSIDRGKEDKKGFKLFHKSFKIFN